LKGGMQHFERGLKRCINEKSSSKTLIKSILFKPKMQRFERG